jgi:hypothetical protein
LPTSFPGFALKFGDNTVCAYGIDTGTDDNALLGCRTVVAGRSPMGSLDAVTPLPGGHLLVAGWVIDPDALRATGVHVWVDGAFKANVLAVGSRADVGEAFPVYGDAHGFDAELTEFTNSQHTVCVYGIDTGIQVGSTTYSPHPLLGCREVTTSGNPIDGSDRLPIGSLDLVDVQAGSVRVAGWTMDPDTTASIAVQFHLDGVLHAGTQADRSRGDVAAAYPVYGDRHGFDMTLFPAPGAHSLCAFGVDSTTPDSNSAKLGALGCRSINV